MFDKDTEDKNEGKVEENTQSPYVLYKQPIISSYTRLVQAKDNQSLPAAIKGAHSQGEKRSWLLLGLR